MKIVQYGLNYYAYDENNQPLGIFSTYAQAESAAGHAQYLAQQRDPRGLTAILRGTQVENWRRGPGGLMGESKKAWERYKSEKAVQDDPYTLSSLGDEQREQRQQQVWSDFSNWAQQNYTMNKILPGSAAPAAKNPNPWGLQAGASAIRELKTPWQAAGFNTYAEWMDARRKGLI